MLEWSRFYTVFSEVYDDLRTKRYKKKVLSDISLDDCLWLLLNCSFRFRFPSILQHLFSEIEEYWTKA